MAEMAAFRYSASDLWRRLPRSIGIHWPGERLLLVASCIAHRGQVRGDGLRPTGADVRPYWEISEEPRPGFVAVTDSRLLHEDRMTALTLLRGLSMALVGLAAVLAISATGITRPVGFLLSGLILLVALRAAELVLLGRRSIPFERVFVEEERSRRFQGYLEDGSVLEFEVSDPADFRRLAAILTEGPAAAA
jgi:hypothetical protein